MNGNEFLKKIKALAKKQGVAVHLDTAHGKGSHAFLHYGDRATVLKDRKKEIPPGLLRAMLTQLGINPAEF